ncbi:MAG: acyl-CoA dehydrogenase family protein [Acidimicrobiia bacterium]
MEHELTSDQEFFGETTKKFLEAECPVVAIRALRDDADGFDRGYWRQGAELGWVALLVSEDDGGGSISGGGLVDLTLVAYQFGRHAAPGPLIPSNIVAGALSRNGSAEQHDVLGAIVAGEAIATWAHPTSAVEVTATSSGDGFVLNGAVRPVEAVAQADYLLVPALVDGAPTQFLVPTATAGVSIKPLVGLDLTRRYGAVSFDGVAVAASAVVGAVGQAADEIERQERIATVLLCAESVGAMETAFEITLEWGFNRYSFGRPLVAYQELKHRFADMKMWLEAGHAITDTAANAVQDDAPTAAQYVAAAGAFVGDQSTELLQDCVQIHGGIGLTYDHDLHLYLRRVTVNRSLHGTPAEHREVLASIAEARAKESVA